MTTTTTTTSSTAATTLLNTLRDNVRDHLLAVIGDIPLDPSDPVHAQILDIYSHVNLEYFRERIAATGALRMLKPGDDTYSTVHLPSNDIIGFLEMLRTIPEVIYAVLAYEHGDTKFRFDDTTDSNTGFYPNDEHELLLAQCATTLYQLYVDISDADTTDNNPEQE